MTTQQTPPKTMHIVLWTLQVILAVLFAMAGTMKVFQPIDQLSQMLNWVTSVPVLLVRFIGVCELTAALGLLLPSLLRIMPSLTRWAALGIAAIMAFAMVFHLGRGETSVIGMNLVFGLIALFIAWGRSKRAPIPPRV
jgi:putative oxidoreductase